MVFILRIVKGSFFEQLRAVNRERIIMVTLTSRLEKF